MKTHLSIAIVFLLVFLAGGVSGWFLRPVSDPSPPNIVEQGGRRLWSTGSAAERTDKFMEDFHKQLALSAEQTTAVRPIVESTMRKYIRFDNEYMRLRKSAHDEAVRSIRPLLDPEQQEKLDTLDQSSNQRFQRAWKKVDPTNKSGS